jgi:hypothetical protein
MTTTDELLERIDELEAEQAQLRKQLGQTQSQYQQVTGLFEQFKHGSISRRAFLTSVTALAGVGFAAGNASAAPDWSAATGYAGTEAQPLLGVNASSGTFESLSTDALLLGSGPTSVDRHLTEVDSDTVSTSGGTLSLSYSYEPEDLTVLSIDLDVASATTVEIVLDGDTTSSYNYWDETGTKVTGETSWLVYDSTQDATPATGDIIIGQADSQRRMAYNSQLLFRTVDRINTFADRGGSLLFDSSTIEITGDLTAGSEATLYAIE